MKKIFIASFLGVVVLVGGIIVYMRPQAVSAPKVYHVGILNALDFFSDTTLGFKKKMTELGYVEGVNIFYDEQKAPAPVGNENVIKKFVDEKVDLILSFPTEASLEAKRGVMGTNIPVVFGNAFIESNDLVESIAHPGGNITGVRFPGVDMSMRRLELLHELAPKAKRFWIPYLKDYPSVPPQIEKLEPFAASLGLILVETPFSSPAELSTYIDAQSSSKNIAMDAVLMIAEPFGAMQETLDAVHKFADTHQLPVVGARVVDKDVGPALSLFENSFAVGGLAATLADKIFKGTPAGEIPVISPENELSINVKVIQKLGLVASEGLLSQAVTIVH